MEARKIPSIEVGKTLDKALYEKLEDGTYAGRIPGCVGVIAFADSSRGCERRLRTTLEDWLLVGLELGHELPTRHHA